MHVGLILPSYSVKESMQIPALALLASGLSSRVNLTVIPLRNAPGIREMRLNGIDILDVGGERMRFRTLMRDALAMIRQRHTHDPFDIFHSYWLFEPGAIATAAGRITGRPVVASIGGAELANIPTIGYGGSRTRRGRKLNQAILRAATTVTGGSNYVLGLARTQRPGVSRNLQLAPLPVELPAGPAGNSPYDGAESFQLLQVGAYLPVKGHDISIRALATLRQQRDVFLTMIGENPYGYKQRIHALARSLGVDDRLTLLDRIPHRDLLPYFQHADLLLMPSRHESQGMVVLEAGAAGLPAVGTPVGVLADLAPAAGVTSPIDDVPEFAAAIDRLLADESGRREVAARVRQRVIEEYALSPVIDRWVSVYAEAVRGA